MAPLLNRFMTALLVLTALAPLRGEGLCASFHITGEAPQFARIGSDGKYYTTSEARAFSGTLSEVETRQVMDDACAIQDMGAANASFCGVR